MRTAGSRLGLGWVLLALGAGTAAAWGPPGKGSYRDESLVMARTTRTDSPEVTRTWKLYRPPGAEAGTKVPALLFLHGFGGTARGGARNTGFAAVADAHGFLVAYLDGLCKSPRLPRVMPFNSQGWNDGSGRGFWAEEGIDDVGFVARVIDALVGDEGADPARIYVCGHSFGASMTFRVGTELADRVAAIAPVAGALWIKNPAPARPVPMLYVVGELDPLTPPCGGPVRLFGKTVEKRPTREGVAAWGRGVGCKGGLVRIPGREGLTVERCEGCEGALEVFHVEIAGQGHGFPGGWTPLPRAMIGPDVDTYQAAEAIWDFFAKWKR